MRHHVGRAAGIGALAGYSALQWLGRTYGATKEERRRAMPGDARTPHPMAQTTHAITIDASPAQIWPWLVQMGWDRGGWYTSEWVDRLLFPLNAPSADVIVPALQHLEVGDAIADGPPDAECYFVVAEIERGQHLVLHSAEHLPPSWQRRFKAWIDWTWAFAIDDLGNGRSRFIVRSRFRIGPWWAAAVYLLAVVPADFVMSRQMLRGVRARAEGTSTAALVALSVGNGHR
jgi:hypothetical protein